MPASRTANLATRLAWRVRSTLERYQHARTPPLTPSDTLRSALGLDDLGPFFETFRTRGRPRFFFDSSDAPGIVDDLTNAVPSWREELIFDAARICGGKVRILGGDEIVARVATTLPGRAPIAWHSDIFRDYRWDSEAFYKAIAIPYNRADIKVPWELSRCQHLATVGMAYRATGEARYASEVVTQIDDWIEHNQLGYGVNWSNTMEVAIRAVNWLWAYHLIAPSPAITDEFLERFLSSVLAHGRHICRNIERYRGGVTTNHTLADYVGLLYIGLFLSEFPEAADWVDVAMSEIETCMQLQVNGDGVDFENSVAYHRLALEMFVGSYLLAQKNGRTFSDSYRSSLEQMFEFVYHYLRPDGLAPMVGDNDDGRLQILSRYFDWQPQDHRYLLAIGAIVCGREEFWALAQNSAAATEEAAWLLGFVSAAPVKPRPILPVSRAFPHSGRYIMRDGGNHVFISADEVGTGGLGNHKHNDIFSFELSVSGVAMVVDPGSFLYTSDLLWRNHFRSTRAHNTVVVDDTEQNELTEVFGMSPSARVDVVAWNSASEYDVFEGIHTGYERLPNPVAHRRLICFRKEPPSWLVVDTLLGRGLHTVESGLHFASGGWIEQLSDRLNVPRTTATIASLCRRVDLPVPSNLPSELYTYARRGVEIGVVPLTWEGTSIEHNAVSGWVSARYGPAGRGAGALLIRRGLRRSIFRLLDLRQSQTSLTRRR